MSKYAKIPLELRILNQWVVWKYVDRDGKQTKVPFNPKTGQYADTIAASTWGSFAEAVHAESYGFDGIGFVLSVNDPYAFIDLDYIVRQSEHIQNVHRGIYEKFNSYSEWSPSGEGIHIIVKGSVPAGRNDRSKACEIYSSGRYLTFTGNVCRDVAIAERSELCLQLWSELGGSDKQDTSTAQVQQFATPQLADDAVIYNKALAATNGAKFERLWQGLWAGDYPSQSEADLTLVNILQFYSKNPEQIRRMFLLSGLGQRDKARRVDYMNWMIGKAFDRELPPVTLDFGPQSNAALEAARALAASTPEPQRPVLTPPPGLLGDIARFIYDAAPRPIAEAAVVAAIGLLAGICGKAFNVSGTGLNQYVMFVADSGVGKEGIARGIGIIMHELELRCPIASGFLGPGKFASAQGLLKSISNSKTKGSMVSVIGEFGLQLKTMCGEKASPVDTQLLASLLDFYNKSGNRDVVREVAYSDSTKNIPNAKAPSLSIIAEGETNSVYNNINESVITGGLLPRFTIIRYNGPRPYEREGFADLLPSENLIKKLAELCDLCMRRITESKVHHVQLNAETKEFDRQFNKFCDDKINDSSKRIVRTIWSRTRLKVLKLAALIAVSIDAANPIIDMVAYNWAYDLVYNEAVEMTTRSQSGELSIDIDDLENEQLNVVVTVIHNMIVYGRQKSMRTCQTMFNDGIILANDIVQRCSNKVAFKKDTRTKNIKILEDALRTMEDGGMLAIIRAGSADLQNKGYENGGTCFKITNFKLIQDHMKRIQ